MKKIITVLIAVCIVIVSALVVLVLSSKKEDEPPEIFCISELLEISVNTTEKELLANAISTDKEDGNLSYKIGIESISKFDEDMLRTVQYTVSDSHGNVSRASCKIRYIDYEATHFDLYTVERYVNGEDIKLHEHIKADDILDGDISKNIELFCDISRFGIGTYPFKVSVRNSAGAESLVTVYVQVIESTEYLPTIYLNEYIKYVDIGEEIDLFAMIQSVDSAVVISSEGQYVDIYEPFPREDVKISGNVDTNTKGEYCICYSATNSLGVTGISYLTVVVE